MADPTDELNAELEARGAAAPTAPHVDVEVAALQAQEARERPTPAPRRPPPPTDPEVIGSAIAARLIAEEAVERKAMADRRRGAATSPGAERPFQVSQRKVRDRFAVGKEFVKPGHVSQWARLVDGIDGKLDPSAERIEMYKDYGYEPVLNGKGEEIRTTHGLLMQARPEQYAARVRDCMPEGALDRDVYANNARATIEAGNSQQGGHVARVVGDGVTIDRL